MKITCPKDATHDKFYVTAHVAEEWVVNDKGDWECTVESGGGDIVHRPDSQDLYTCRDCATEAKVIS
jgi:hypothetical protein